MRPSDYCTIHPWDSKKHNNEHEVVARNIMVILSRTGNEWRELSWDEYQSERLKDGGFTELEHRLFDNVKECCASPEAAQSFSPAWLEITEPNE